MKIFISWSGERSKYIGGILKKWIPKIIQQIDIWYSTKDVPKGRPWFDKIRNELKDTNFGIVCLTPENVDSKWLHFEAGAIQKQVKECAIFTLLYDLKIADITFPLAGFQHTKLEKDDFKSLIDDINGMLEEKIDAADLTYCFEHVWQDIEKEMGKIPPPNKEEPKPVKRGEEEKLDAILASLRNLELKSSEPEYIEYQPEYGIGYPSGLSIDPYASINPYIRYGDEIKSILKNKPNGLDIDSIYGELIKKFPQIHPTEIFKILDYLNTVKMVNIKVIKGSIYYSLP